MKFTDLVIQNFGPIGNATINLADRGLFGIVGVNKDDTSADSNGAGKSTIPDALCWCLFGTTARDLEGDRVVHRTIGKDCRVDISIEDGAEKYTVIRYRKDTRNKNMVKLFQQDSATGNVTDLTQGTDKLTQAKIDKIIGCSYEVFKAAIYAGQEQMPDLPGMTDKQLKVLVEESAGINLLESAYELARQDAVGAAKNLVAAQAQIDSAVRNVVVAKDHRMSMMTSQGDWLTKQKDDISLQHTYLTDLKNQIKAIDKSIRALVPLKDLTHRRDILNATLASIGGEQLEERRLVKIESDATIEHSNLRNQLLTIKRDVETRQKVLAAPPTGPSDCSECGQTIPDDPVARKAHIEAQTAAIKKRVSDFNALKVRSVAASESVTAASKALSDYRATMTDTSAASAELKQVNLEIAEVEKLYADRKTTQALGEAVIKQIDVMEKTDNPFNAKCATAEAQLLIAESHEVAVRKAFEIAEDAKVLADQVAKVFGPAGVRAQILDSVTPYLNDRTAEYLSTLSDGNITAVWTTLTADSKGALKERFSIDVDHAEGGDCFKAISGGEKRKVRLSCMLALQDLVASRATKPIDLWIGDEIDHALDPAGLERLMTVLTEKARVRGTVAIISHNSISDWVRDIVTVEKSGKMATLVAT